MASSPIAGTPNVSPNAKKTITDLTFIIALRLPIDISSAIVPSTETGTDEPHAGDAEERRTPALTFVAMQTPDESNSIMDIVRTMTCREQAGETERLAQSELLKANATLS